MAKNKKRFKIIDKGNHVIKKDLMTSTVYSYPKEEDSMELTKEEIKKVIKWLEDYYVLSDYKPEDFPDDIDGLPTITHKFKTYLEGGEN